MIRALPFLLFLIATPLLAAEPIIGRVVSIADGDTITVLNSNKTQQKIRLHGIDAPEKSQAFGTKSKDALAALVFQKDVVVTVVDKDRYGRWVGEVRQGGVDVNARMVRDGWCWRYPTYDKAREYAAAQAEAQKEKRGLWADKDPVPPWEFRKKR